MPNSTECPSSRHSHQVGVTGCHRWVIFKAMYIDSSCWFYLISNTSLRMSGTTRPSCPGTRSVKTGNCCATSTLQLGQGVVQSTAGYSKDTGSNEASARTCDKKVVSICYKDYIKTFFIGCMPQLPQVSSLVANRNCCCDAKSCTDSETLSKSLL